MMKRLRTTTAAVLPALLLVTPLLFYWTPSGFAQSTQLTVEEQYQPPAPQEQYAVTELPAQQQVQYTLTKPVYEQVSKVVVPDVIRVYSFREMLDGLEDNVNVEVSMLISNIMEDQLKDEFPTETIRLYRLFERPAVILTAPQPVHDAVEVLLQDLKEVCETLKKLEEKGGVQPVPVAEAPDQQIIRVYRLKNTLTADVAHNTANHYLEMRQQLNTNQAFDESLCIVAEPQTNSVVIKGSPGDVEKIQKLIEELDREPLQVMEELHQHQMLLQQSAFAPSTVFLNPGTVQPSANPLWAKIEETEKKLEQTANFPLPLEDEKHLGNLIVWLSDNGLYVIFDIQAFTELPIAEGAPLVAAAYEDVPVSRVLNRALKPLGLVYTINEDGDLVITSPERENEMMLTRVHEVGRDEENNQHIHMALTAMIQGSVPQRNTHMPRFVLLPGGKLVVDAPYSVHKKTEKILMSMSM